MRQFADLATTTLDGAISAAADTFALASATNFPAAPFDVKINNELLLVKARSGVTCSNVQRAQGGTVAAAHAHGDTVKHVFTAASLRSVKATTTRKPSNTAYTNNVLASDPHLTFSILANEVWQVEYVLFVSSPSLTPDIRASLSVPTGASFYWGKRGYRTIVSGTITAVSSGEAELTSGSGSIAAGLMITTAAPYMMLVFKGMVVNGANDGTVALQCSMNASTGGPITLLANSFMKVREVAA